MTAEIRRAEVGDMEEAVQLMSLLHRTHETLDRRYVLSADAPLRWANDFRELIRSERHRYFVAEAVAGKLVGLLVAQALLPLPLYEPNVFVHINELIVAHDFRGQGIGQRLVQEALQWAKEIEATDVRVGVLATNQESRTFWKRLGGVDYSIEMIIESG